MEGRTIVRPDVVAAWGGSVSMVSLQWRAGQSSGQTFGADVFSELFDGPSMEGRTIVRPDACAHRDDSVVQTPSMEGRTIVRPDSLT